MMREFNANSPCAGLIETRHTISRCGRAARYWVRPSYSDSERGEHACKRHLTQVCAEVAEASGAREVVVREFGGSRC